jgi:peptidoglycan/xylan/chitin deacetylase (PgdA/CDA1 family)
VEKPIVITFDDGWASDTRYAAPILDRLGWRSEHFVTVDWIGRSGFMSWAALTELMASNRGIHSHTMTHADLDRMGAAELQRELALSKSILESALGRVVDFLALPGGTGAAAPVVQLARSLGYLGICTSKIGVNRPGADPYWLRRITVTANTSLDMLLRWVDGADLLHSKLQQAALRRVRGLLGSHLYESLKEALLRRLVMTRTRSARASRRGQAS